MHGSTKKNAQNENRARREKKEFIDRIFENQDREVRRAMGPKTSRTTLTNTTRFVDKKRRPQCSKMGNRAEKERIRRERNNEERKQSEGREHERGREEERHYLTIWSNK